MTPNHQGSFRQPQQPIRPDKMAEMGRWTDQGGQNVQTTQPTWADSCDEISGSRKSSGMVAKIVIEIQVHHVTRLMSIADTQMLFSLLFRTLFVMGSSTWRLPYLVPSQT